MDYKKLKELKAKINEEADLTLKHLSVAYSYDEQIQIVEASIKVLDARISEALKSDAEAKTRIYAAKYAALKRIINGM